MNENRNPGSAKEQGAGRNPPAAGRKRSRRGSTRPRTESQPAKASPGAAPPPRQRGPLVLAGGALVIALVTSVAGYFIWHELNQVGRSQEGVTSKLGQELGDTREELRDTVQELKETNAAMQDRLAEQLTQLTARESAMQDSLAVLRAQLGSSQEGWKLAETQYLLRVANSRIKLQRDVASALAALQDADQRLQEVADPGYLPVREAIATEIAALKAVPAVDVAGYALAIESLTGRIEELPLRESQYRPPPQADAISGQETWSVAENWRELPGIIWQALRELVDVRRHGQPVGPMLAPEQQYFIYQNLRLQLEAARVAVLREDPANARISLAAAQDWLQEYFDTADAGVGGALTEIQRLLEKEIRPPLPDISASLRLLRQQLVLAGMSSGDAGNSPGQDAEQQ